MCLAPFLMVVHAVVIVTLGAGEMHWCFSSRLSSSTCVAALHQPGNAGHAVPKITQLLTHFAEQCRLH